MSINMKKYFCKGSFICWRWHDDTLWIMIHPQINRHHPLPTLLQSFPLVGSSFVHYCKVMILILICIWELHFALHDLLQIVFCIDQEDRRAFSPCSRCGGLASTLHFWYDRSATACFWWATRETCRYSHKCGRPLRKRSWPPIAKVLHSRVL